MAYLGRQPLVGNYQVLDAITASATDTYALTKSGVAVFPQTPANCIVSLNGVIQAPTDSYTISGSNIVFASALTGSDSIDFITVLGDVLNVGTVSDNTITTGSDSLYHLLNLTATGTKDATTFLRGDNTFASAGGTNTPYFRAERTTNQSTTTYVGAKIQFNTVTFDSASGFDNTTNYRYTIPSGQGGYWFIQISMGTFFTSNNGGVFILDLKRNGSTVQSSVNVTVDSGTSIYRHRNQTITAILNLSASDYLEGFGTLVGTSPAIRGDAKETFIQGFRLVQ
jgi:hypothetical protein